MTRGGVGLLFVLMAALALAWGAELTLGERAASMPVPVAPAPVATKAGVEPDRAPGWAATALARPLFNPDRRPVAPPPAAAAATAPAELPRLSGVMVTPAGRRAIFAGPANGRPVTVAEGQRIGLFLVNKIETGAVTLLGPDGPRRITPHFATGAEATSIAPQPAAPATAGGPVVSGADLIRSPPNIPIPAATRR